LSASALQIAGFNSVAERPTVSRMLETAVGMQTRPDAIKKIYHSTVGDGPRELPASASLLNTITGLPNKKPATN